VDFSFLTAALVSPAQHPRDQGSLAFPRRWVGPGGVVEGLKRAPRERVEPPRTSVGPRAKPSNPPTNPVSAISFSLFCLPMSSGCGCRCLLLHYDGPRFISAKRLIKKKKKNPKHLDTSVQTHTQPCRSHVLLVVTGCSRSRLWLLHASTHQSCSPETPADVPQPLPRDQEGRCPAITSDSTAAATSTPLLPLRRPWPFHPRDHGSVPAARKSRRPTWQRRAEAGEPARRESQPICELQHAPSAGRGMGSGMGS
jgi:hypothetical protein